MEWDKNRAQKNKFIFFHFRWCGLSNLMRVCVWGNKFGLTGKNNSWKNLALWWYGCRQTRKARSTVHSIAWIHESVSISLLHRRCKMLLRLGLQANFELQPHKFLNNDLALKRNIYGSRWTCWSNMLRLYIIWFLQMILSSQARKMLWKIKPKILAPNFLNFCTLSKRYEA